MSRAWPAPNPSNLQFTAKIAKLFHIRRHGPEGYIVADDMGHRSIEESWGLARQPLRQLLDYAQLRSLFSLQIHRESGGVRVTRT
jgi:hypothetical protein